MKEVILSPFSTILRGVFVPYVGGQRIDKKLYRQMHFKCGICGERAKHDIARNKNPKMVLDCPCRKNRKRTVSLVTWGRMAEAAEKVPLKQIR
jgi:hypothetical protein